MKRIERVLALHSYRSEVWDAQYAGLCRYAVARGWRVEELYFPRRVDFRKVVREIEKGGVAGVINSTDAVVPAEVSGRVGVVYFDCSAEGLPEGAPNVRHSDGAVAHLAACELAARDVGAFAYAGARCSLYWNAGRGEAFRREAEGRGVEWAGAFAFGAGRGRAAAMAGWVAGLPKPCGVFAANDETAREVAAACGRVGARVPEDVAVVGVDNDLGICLGAPELTSILPDWNAGAFLAVQTLDRLLRGRAVPEGMQHFKPLGIVRRRSTGGGATKGDPRILRAMELIRAEACAGLRAARVAREFRGSRRNAEAAFRRATGMSILEAIRNVRFENAAAALSGTDVEVARVAEDSGFRSVGTFCNEFRERTGMTPMEWRRKERG